MKRKFLIFNQNRDNNNNKKNVAAFEKKKSVNNIGFKVN